MSSRRQAATNAERMRSKSERLRTSARTGWPAVESRFRRVGANETSCARHQDHVTRQLLREVLAKKDEKTGSGFPVLHLGHFSRLFSRSLMPMVTVNFLPHSRHLKSYVGTISPRGVKTLEGLTLPRLAHTLAVR